MSFQPADPSFHSIWGLLEYKSQDKEIIFIQLDALMEMRLWIGGEENIKCSSICIDSTEEYFMITSLGDAKCC